MAEKITSAERFIALQQLVDWTETEDEDAITKKYTFETFLDAIEFIKQVADFAEKHNHHPTWTNTYNKVIVVLSTHDCGGVSAKDIALAHHMEKVAYTLFNRGKIDPTDLIF